MNSSNAVLVVDQLSHVYQSQGGSVSVLNDISFEVGLSQMVAVRGESGSGKTTLLLACGAMQPPTSGVIELNGHNLYAMSSAQRTKFRAAHIGYLFQTLELVPYLNLIDNVRLADGVTRLDANKWLDRLGLADRILHKPESLSHGQRQRAALARALAHQPDLVIADEPTGNLDEKNSQLVFETLREFADAGGAVLVATHESKVESYADTVIAISNDSMVESNE